MSYGAVGASRAPDLMRFPPRGYRPVERIVRIGHGVERWEHAWVRILSWGVQRGAGFTVTPYPAPAEASAASYRPVNFDDAGDALSPAALEGDEALYAPSGEPLLHAGDTGMLKSRWWPRAFPVRVVYTVDEPARRGAAFGTLPGHALAGEELLQVERRSDDSVWFTVRIFSRPSGGIWRLARPVLWLAQRVFVRRYLRDLAGPIPVG